ncbi:MAG: hypothetical protein HFG20_06285 [Anaerotruncus sp.]|nr:hypothetical protein [Anaerotruncus sp.]
MRIAQRMMSRNYKRTMNNTLSKRAEAFERGTSGVAFSRLSENIAAGVRAMKIQEERMTAKRQLNTVENFIEEFNSVYNNLDSIDSILQKAQEKVEAGKNDPKGQTGREIIAQELGELKKQALQFANAQYAGKFLFSGTNNAEAPFTEENGKLCFNGVPVEEVIYEGSSGTYRYYEEITDQDLDVNAAKQVVYDDGTTQIPLKDIKYDQVTKTFYTEDAAAPNGKSPVPDDLAKSLAVSNTGKVLYKGREAERFSVDDQGGIQNFAKVPYSDDVYVDIGLGLKIDGNINVDMRSAFQTNFNGLLVFGYGAPVGGEQHGNTVPNNAYDVLTELEEEFKKADFDHNKVDDLWDKLVSLNDKMRLSSRTELDTRAEFLNRSKDRLDKDIDTLEETETKLISADPYEEAINLKNSEYTWMAVLQLGSKLLPSSLLDFMR